MILQAIEALLRNMEDVLDKQTRLLHSEDGQGYRHGFRDATVLWRDDLEEIIDDYSE